MLCLACLFPAHQTGKGQVLGTVCCETIPFLLLMVLPCGIPCSHFAETEAKSQGNKILCLSAGVKIKLRTFCCVHLVHQWAREQAEDPTGCTSVALSRTLRLTLPGRMSTAPRKHTRGRTELCLGLGSSGSHRITQKAFKGLPLGDSDLRSWRLAVFSEFPRELQWDVNGFQTKSEKGNQRCTLSSPSLWPAPALLH